VDDAVELGDHHNRALGGRLRPDAGQDEAEPRDDERTAAAHTGILRPIRTLASYRSSSQILEAVLSLPEGAQVELRAPVFRIYGEDLDVVFTEVRKTA
jgi:hypothetical protein